MKTLYKVRTYSLIIIFRGVNCLRFKNVTNLQNMVLLGVLEHQEN